MSRTSSSTEGSNSREVSPTSPSAKVQFDSALPDGTKKFLQFHVITATLSEKASGKRPASSFIGMAVGKHNYTTSTVNGRDSDPVWHDNLGPMWLKDDTKITFKLRSRSLPLVPAQTIATTKTYKVHELIELQKDLYDRNCTIKLPLEPPSTSNSPPSSPRNTKNTQGSNTSALIINLRLPSSAETATEEVARARVRSNSVRLEQQQLQQRLEQQQQQQQSQQTQRHGLLLKPDDIDSEEDLRLEIDRKAALGESSGSEAVVYKTIEIIPRITVN
ncbi:hypothetical protein E1B28_010281 [Marasmius oreades]|uniref:Uncharacterized protein n=1 Tax=Marasmius oreades TaxID=181124 RepID=A0A9P7RWY3_9AGAR|nr:uncharacterized protein E1B28_010281 [Marasmius oreades]KAG7091230.1 hypothetical protein E1B28_010281 [Marasmius oreades]